MKRYIKEVSILTLSLLLIPLIFAIFNLFEIKITSIFYLISIVSITFVAGIILGKNCKNNAYKKGLVLGTVFIIVMFLLSIILDSSLSFNMIIYYLIVLSSTTLGSMLGIQKR